LVLNTVPRRFRDTEVGFARSIGHLLATAVEHEQVEARLRDSNRQLQQALLPAELPVLPGIVAAARYVPAGGDRVGGDWYDVLPLPYGGVGLVMGDVEGHDQTAAALMGQIRTVVRAYAAEGHTPGEILTALNRFVSGHLQRLVTCCYAELDAEQRTVTCVSAGHPVPLVLQPRPALEPLPVATGLILGVDADQDYLEHTELLPQACALLMVTDGLVDDLPGAVHHGFEALAAIATAAAGEPIQTFADRVAAPSSDDAGSADPRDDAALLAVQITTAALPGCDTVRRRFANRPVASRAARTFVDDILTAWHLDPLREPAVLAASELVTNAVTHTTSPVEISLCRAGPDRIRLAVHDDSDRPLRPGRPPRLDDLQSLEPVGRGLVIIGHIADRWGVDLSTETAGKTIWLELSATLPGPHSQDRRQRRGLTPWPGYPSPGCSHAVHTSRPPPDRG
jgi:serine phosphatase RsbU (regulator of sigma subunit)/anti-sigma regulatory factor (Ser/Thr protein kinase)